VCLDHLKTLLSYLPTRSKYQIAFSNEMNIKILAKISSAKRK
jgi:hypothetical protein